MSHQHDSLLPMELLDPDTPGSQVTLAPFVCWSLVIGVVHSGIPSCLSLSIVYCFILCHLSKEAIIIH
jgi:hypothetical protein